MARTACVVLAAALCACAGDEGPPTRGDRGVDASANGDSSAPAANGSEEAPDAGAVPDSTSVADTAPSCPVVHDPNALGLESLAPGLGGMFDAAKRACDAEHRWQCGDFQLTFDQHGCLQAIGVRDSAQQLPGDYVACLVRRMATQCSPCARAKAGRVYESCTLAKTGAGLLLLRRSSFRQCIRPRAANPSAPLNHRGSACSGASRARFLPNHPERP
jgi:hypothetical protein